MKNGEQWHLVMKKLNYILMQQSMSEYQLVQETMQRYTKIVKFIAGSLMVRGYLKRNGARKLIKLMGYWTMKNTLLG